jgi:hypothetical protein
MLGSSDSHGSAPTEPVEHGRSDLPSQGQIPGYIDLSRPGGLMLLRLFQCAQAVSSNDWEIAHDRIRGLLGSQLSAQGDSYERVASYFTTALATHISKATGTQVSHYVVFHSLRIFSQTDCLETLSVCLLVQASWRICILGFAHMSVYNPFLV